MEDGHNGAAAVLAVDVQGVDVVQQLQQKQSHGELVGPPLVRLLVDQGPDHVLRQVLHRQQPRRLEVEVFSPAVVLAEGADQEPGNGVVLPHHLEGGVEELRQHHEVHGDVVGSCREDFVAGVLVQKEEVSGFQDHGLAVVDDLGGGSLADKEDFHEIVPVLREVDEPGVGADVDELALLQHPAAVDGEVLGPGVEAAVHAGSAVQNFLFLVGDPAESLHEFRVHAAPSFLIGGSEKLFSSGAPACSGHGNNFYYKGSRCRPACQPDLAKTVPFPRTSSLFPS